MLNLKTYRTLLVLLYHESVFVLLYSSACKICDSLPSCNLGHISQEKMHKRAVVVPVPNGCRLHKNAVMALIILTGTMLTCTETMSTDPQWPYPQLTPVQALCTRAVPIIGSANISATDIGILAHIGNRQECYKNRY